MRSIRVFLFIIILLSVNACFPASVTPTHTTSPTVTIKTVTAVPLTPTGTPISSTKPVITSTHAIALIKPTLTAGVENIISILPSETLTITIVYDNNSFDQRLSLAWGFSALVEYGEYTLLFDTGGDGQILMGNMRILGIDPSQIDSVVLSHTHEDHTGGLTALLNTGVNPVVYLLPSFPASFKRQIEKVTQVSEVLPGQAFTDGLWTTGEVGGMIPEQALVIQTDQGLVVITGCAHPGIVAILEQAQTLFAEPVQLVLGGFHLGDKSEAEIGSILNDFRRLEIKQVAPCHCTGEYAISRFAAEYGKDFLHAGAGRVIQMESSISK